MAMQSYALTPGRIEKFKGKILKTAEPLEILAKFGKQVPMPKNNSRNYVARRWLPYGGTSTNQNTINRFFTDGTGDRGNVIVQANQVAEGITPVPDSVTPVDTTVVMQQYAALYGLTDVTYNLYEDDVAGAMFDQSSKRMVFVNELIIYGALKACTNAFFGGTGTTRATVNGAITLPSCRAVIRNLKANHAEPIATVLKAGPNFGTSPVPRSYTAICHTNLEGDLRDLPNFIPVERYATGTAMPGEIGSCEGLRFVLHPDLPEFQDAGATVASTGGQFFSTTGTNIDVYPVIVLGQDAFSQVSVKGSDNLKPTFIMPGTQSASDPFGQRGYVGQMWWKAVLLENQGWMAVLNVARRV